MKPPAETLSGVVERNLDALLAARRAALARRSSVERAVDGFTGFVGSLAFVGLHAALLLFWTLANAGLLGLRPWDHAPYPMLASGAAFEAILLSGLVLVGQRRALREADRRADLDLQTNLLAEHEITRLVAMVDAIARRLDVPLDVPDLDEIERDVAPETVVRQIEAREGNRSEGG